MTTKSQETLPGNVVPHVMVVAYGGSHAATVAPVVDVLRSRGVRVTVLALTTARLVFERLGLASTGYADLLSSKQWEEAERFGYTLLRDVDGASVGVPDRESVAYLGASYADLVASVGLHEAARQYAALGRHAFYPLRTMGRFVDSLQPDIVVATNSPKSERASLEAANERGIPSLMVPDLTADPRWESPYSLPFRAKWYAAMSSVALANLVDGHGILPEHIRLTGQPAMDKSGAPTRAVARQELGLADDDGARTLLLLSSTAPTNLRVPAPPDADRSWSAQVGLSWIEDLLGDARLIVKLHPSEPSDLYDAFATRAGARVVSRSTSIETAVRASDGALALSPSTSLVDSLCLDVPVASIDAGGHPSTPIFESLGVPCAPTEESARDLVRELLSDPSPLRAQVPLRRELSSLNTGAAENVADFILDVVNR